MKNKLRNSVHYVNLEENKEKLETELLFLKDVNIRDKKIIDKIVFPYGNKLERLGNKGGFFRKVIDLKLL